MSRRPLGKRIAWIALALLLLAGAFVALLPRAVELALLAGLRGRGVEEASLRLERLGLSGALATGIRLGRAPELEIAQLELRTSLAGLLSGRIDTLRVSGLDLRVRSDGSSVSYGDLEELLGAPASASRLVLPPLDRLELADARLHVTTPYGSLKLAGEAQGTFANAGIETLRAAAELSHADGDVQGKVEWTLGEDGSVALRAAFSVPRSSERSAPEGSGPAAGAVRFELSLAGALPAARHLSEISSPTDVLATAQLSGEVDLAVESVELGSQRGGGHVHLSLETRPGRLALTSDLLRLELPGMTPLEAGLDVQARLPEPGRIELEDFVLTLSPWKNGSVRLEEASLRLRGAARGASFEGHAELSAAGSGALLDGLRLGHGTLGVKADVTYAESVLSVVLPGCVELVLERLQTPGTLLLPEARVCLEARGAPALRIIRGQNGSPEADATLRLRPFPLELRREQASGIGPWLTGTTPRLDLDLTAGATRQLEASLQLSGGDLRLTETALQLLNLEGKVKLRQDERGVRHETELRVDRVAQVLPKPLLAPLALQAKAGGRGDTHRFELRLGDAAGHLALGVLGTYENGKARGTLKLEPLRFAEGGLQPATLSPTFEEDFGSVSGGLEAAGSFSWSPAGLQSEGRLRVDDLSLKGEFLDVAGVEGDVLFDQLWPPTTPPGQELRFERLQAGLALSDGVIAFSVPSPWKMEIAPSRARVAEGLLQFDGALDYESGSHRLRLQPEGVQLGALLALAEVEGLSASGSLSGSLPLRAEGSHLEITDGRLDSPPGGGRIRYRPAIPPASLLAAGGGGSLVLRALEDFHYELLRARLNGTLDETMEASVELHGSNPAVEDGQPIQLLLSLSGNFGALLRATLLGDRLSELVQRRVMERQRRRSNEKP